MKYLMTAILLSMAAPALACDSSLLRLFGMRHMAPLTHPHLVNAVILDYLLPARMPGEAGPVRGRINMTGVVMIDTARYTPGINGIKTDPYRQAIT